MNQDDVSNHPRNVIGGISLLEYMSGIPIYFLIRIQKWHPIKAEAALISGAWL